MPQPPRQFQRTVYEIAAAVRATELAAFAITGPSTAPRLPLLMHRRSDKANSARRDAAIEAFRTIARPCLQQLKDGVIELPSAEINPQSMQYCLVRLLWKDEQTPSALVQFIVRRPDKRKAREALEKAVAILLFPPNN